MNHWIHDLRLAFRSLKKRPGLTLIAVLTLALGVGANTAIFSVVHGVLLRPMGFAAESDLFALTATSQTEGESRPGSSIQDFGFYRAHQRSFEQISFFGWNSMTLEEPGLVQQLEGVYIGPELFDLLGVEPLIGRALTSEDAPAGRRGDAALISSDLWQRVWGGDPSLVGRTVQIEGRSVLIAGVVAATSSLPNRSAEIWVPVGFGEEMPLRFGPEERDFMIVGRLAKGVSVAQAGDELKGLAASLAEDFPATNGDWSVAVEPLRRHLIGDSERPILIAFGAVLLVLLIACANIAHLLLVRASGREQEMAVRAALGAGRLDLARQMLVEGSVLGLLGGSVGMLAALWMHDLLLLMDPGVLPRADSVTIDGTVLGFGLLASLGTGLACAAVPAWRNAVVMATALRVGSRRSIEGRGGIWRNALLAAEVGLALVLLAGAGLLIRSLHELDQVDPGFRPEETYTSHFVLDDSAYDPPAPRVVFFDRLREEVAAIPGVQSAALTTTPPVPETGIIIDVPYRSDQDPPLDEGSSRRAAFRVVSPGYFETVGIPQLAGRDFNRYDDAKTPEVVIINRTLARRLWGDDQVVGRRFEIFFGQAYELEVVGVVGDTRFTGLHATPRPAFFLPHAQMPFRGMAVVVRTSLGGAAFAESLRRVSTRLDPLLPPGEVRSLEQRLERSVGLERFFGFLLGAFALVALLLAAAGIYGVFSYSVSRRTREIGVRMALGAKASQVAGSVLRQGLAVALGGMLVGCVGAALLSQALVRAFEGVAGLDLATLGIVGVLLTAVAGLSCWIPALRASRVEPSSALRSE